MKLLYTREFYIAFFLFICHSAIEASIAKVANNTPSPLELNISFLLSSSLKKLVEAEEREKVSMGWGPNCVTGVSIQANEGIYAGMTLKYGHLPCGDIRLIVGHDIIDKYKSQRELQSLKDQLDTLENQKIVVGSEITARQLVEHQKVAREIQGLQHEIETHENLISEFDKKLTDLQNLLPSLRKDNPTRATQLQTRIDSTIKTGKLVRALTLYPVTGGGYGSMTKWPGMSGETEAWRLVQGGRGLEKMLDKDPSQWQFPQK